MNSRFDFNTLTCFHRQWMIVLRSLINLHCSIFSDKRHENVKTLLSVVRTFTAWIEFPIWTAASGAKSNIASINQLLQFVFGVESCCEFVAFWGQINGL